MTEGLWTRRGVLGLAALGVGLAGCSAPSSSPPSGTTAASAGATTAAAGDAAREAYIAEGPAPLDPSAFAHGDFVGAIDIQYSGARTSATAKEADAKYAAYFKGKYSPPEPGERNVVRLNAMGDPRDGNRLLFKGAVMDNITLPNAIVVGLHNITQISASRGAWPAPTAPWWWATR